MKPWRTWCLLIFIFFSAGLLFANSPKQLAIQKQVHKDLFGHWGLFKSNVNFQDAFMYHLDTPRRPHKQAELLVSAIESEKIKGLKLGSKLLRRRLTKNPEYRAQFLEQLEEAIKNGALLKEHLETKKARQSVRQQAWRERMNMGDGTLFLWIGSTMASMVIAPALGPVSGPVAVLSSFVLSLFHGPILKYKLTQTPGREYKASLKALKSETAAVAAHVKQVTNEKYKLEVPANFIKLGNLPDGSILSISREQLSSATAFRNTLDIYRSVDGDKKVPALYSKIPIPPAVRGTQGGELQEAREQRVIEYLQQSLENPNFKLCLSSMGAVVQSSP